jgi:hypothetical protein
VIVLRSPKGWTGLEQVDGLEVKGSWRSHLSPGLAVLVIAVAVVSDARPLILSTPTAGHLVTDDP